MIETKDGEDQIVSAPRHLAALRGRPTGELEDSYRQLDALEAAVRAEKLEVLAVLDERDVGREDGAIDTIAWVAEVSRVTLGHARELVETAAALRELPAIRAAAESGELSWDQLVPLAQLATAADDEDWAKRAPGWSAAQLARAVRAHRVVTTETAQERDRARRVTWWWDRD